MDKTQINNLTFVIILWFNLNSLSYCLSIKEEIIELVPILESLVKNCSSLANQLEYCHSTVYNSLENENEIKVNCCLPFMIFDCLKPSILTECDQSAYKQFMIDVDNYRNQIQTGLCLRYTLLLDCESPIPQAWLLLIGVLIVTSIILLTIWFLLRSSSNNPVEQTKARSTFELRSESFRLIPQPSE